MLKRQCPPFSLRRPNARAMFGVSNDCVQEMFVLTSTGVVARNPSVHHTKTVFFMLFWHTFSITIVGSYRAAMFVLFVDNCKARAMLASRSHAIKNLWRLLRPKSHSHLPQLILIPRFLYGWHPLILNSLVLFWQRSRKIWKLKDTLFSTFTNKN